MKRLRKKVSSKEEKQAENAQEQTDEEKELLQADLQITIQKVIEALGHSTDIVVREFIVHEDRQAGLIYTDGLVDSTIVQEVVESLIFNRNSETSNKTKNDINLIDLYKNHYVAIGEVRDVNDIQTLFNAVLSGSSVFLIDGEVKGLAFGTKSWEGRSVEEPATQTVIRGPRESFTENLRTNTALIRRIIKSPNLWMETKEIGKQTKTAVALMYMKGIVDPTLVEEINERLNRIDVDGIFESRNIEELIEDAPYSPFPVIFNTERPDVVAGTLLEGKVAIIVDGTPFVLLTPAVFIQFFQSSEDYYDKFQFATIIRVLRFFCLFISLFGLALFVAVSTFHQEVLPTPLLNSIASQREGVPFPAFIEALVLMGTFEILREAGVRMPRAIGSAISIVGGLVLGQAAVEAGVVSATLVITVAITALSDFVFPSVAMADAIKIFRYVFLALAATFGMYGIGIGVLVLILHLCSIRSFGIPYMSPLGPFSLTDQKDGIVRFPKWAQALRPLFISRQNPVRERMSAPSPKKPNKKK